MRAILRDRPWRWAATVTGIPGSIRSLFWLSRAPWMLPLAVAIALVGAVNLYLAGRSITLVLGGAPAVDWEQLVSAGRRIFTGGDLYAVTGDYSFPYSPLLAYLFGPLSVLGAELWRLLHLAAALALPTWPMRIMCLVSWPFWFDVETGNLLVFIVLAAAWAIRGSGVGIGAYLLLTLLVPRPLMLPLAIWLLWKRPSWRLPFAAAVVVYLVSVAATGWGADWVGFLLTLSSQFESPNNLGPTRVIGAAWLLVGIPLGAYLMGRGHPGLASLAVSYPYVLPYYLLMLIVELPRRFGQPSPPAGDA